MRCDVTQPPELEAAFAHARDHFGSFDVLVSNAVTERWGPLREQTDQDFRASIEINLVAVFYGIKYRGRMMAESGGGVIINTASTIGLTGVPVLGAYCASKAGVLRLTEVAALEPREFGVRGNAVCPGFVSTEMAQRIVPAAEEILGVSIDEFLPPRHGRWGTTEAVARAIASLAGDQAAFITGATLTLDNPMAARAE